MMRRSRPSPLDFGFLLLLLTTASVARTTGERLSLDWIFSEAGKTAASVPEHAWLESGQALLYDKHAAKAERTLEAYDPDTRQRRVLVDQAAAIRSLSELVRPEEPIEELGWPDAFDPRGSWATYERKGRVLVLDVAASRFLALDDSEQGEKSARFSPDGSRLAFVRANDLHVWDSETKTVRRLTTDGSDTLLNGTVSWVYWEEILGRNDIGYKWSPDSKSIAFLQTDESVVDVMSFVDFEPWTPQVIHQRYPRAGTANPRVRAGVVDVESGRTTWIDLGVYPYEYLARIHWLPDSERLVVQTLDRPQTHLDLFLVDAATGQARHLMRETDPAWVNLHDDLVFLEETEQFLWVSERSGYAHIYLYGLDGKLVRQVTDGDWALRASAAVFWQRKAIAAVDEEHGWIYFTALEKSPIEKHLYRIRLDGSGMERLSRSAGTHRIRFSGDRRTYIDSSSAVDRMPSLTLHAADGDLLDTLSAPRPELVERFDLLTPQILTVPSTDGFEMPAMLLEPRGFEATRRYPAVVYVYGGPSAPTVQNAWGGRARDYFEQMLADRGFVVFRVDNRSATAQSKSLENLILDAGYGASELADLLDAVSWLKAQAFVDPNRVGIWGWSGGGSFTLSAMTRSTEFKAGIAVAAVTDWRYYDTKWAEAFMKRPQDNPDGYDETSHALRAEELHGRLLLVHGTYDDNVHPQNAWRFTDELIEAGITFDMMIYPMRKHGIEDDAAQRHLYTTMLEFWNRNLK